MSEVNVKIRFVKHPCTNHTEDNYRIPDPDCNCQSCQCDEEGHCSHCRAYVSSAHCPDCGAEIEQPHCYQCNGDECGCGTTIEYGDDVTYTGIVTASWKNGELLKYSGQGHPHLDGSYCLGDAGPLFENVTTMEQAIEAIVTHISNVNFNDAVTNQHNGIEAA